MCTSRVCQAEGEGNYLVASRDILAGEVVANFFPTIEKILDASFCETSEWAGCHGGRALCCWSQSGNNPGDYNYC